jgi:hypothetical protein
MSIATYLTNFVGKLSSSFAVQSVVRIVFCSMIRLGRGLFGAIHLGSRLLRHDPLGASSFAVQSVGGGIVLVQSVVGVVFCSMICLG